MKKTFLVFLFTVFFISSAWSQLNPEAKSDITSANQTSRTEIETHNRYLTSGLIVSSIFCVILLAGVLLLIKRNRAFLRVISIKNKEIEDNNNRNRAALETAHCNLVDKDILMKKIIRDKDAALTLNAELQSQVMKLNEELNGVLTRQTEKTDESVSDEIALWKQKYEDSQKTLEKHKESITFGEEFREKAEALELNIIKIEKLEKLFSEHVISQEEFEQKRKKLLDEI